MSLRILTPDEAKSKARAKVAVWRKEKTIAAGWQKERLFRAVIADDYETCVDAVNKGADVNAWSDGYGPWPKTPLMLAAWSKNHEIAEFLIGQGADIDASDGYGNTPLLMACIRGRFDVAHVLVENGANLDATNRSGTTALIYCCQDSHSDLAELLIRSGADVNIKALGGETALHRASYVKGNLEIIRLLLDFGADIFARGGPLFDKTPHGTAIKPEFEAAIREHAMKEEPHAGLVRLDVLDALLDRRDALDGKGISHVTVALSVSSDSGATLDGIDPYQAEEMLAQRISNVLRRNKKQHMACRMDGAEEIKVEFPVRYPYCSYGKPQDDKEDDMHGIESITSG